MLILISVMILVLGGAHYYLWRRLVRDARLKPLWRRTLTSTLGALYISVPLTMMLFRNVTRETISPLAHVSFLWLGLLSTLVIILGATDVVRILRRLITRNSPPENESRRLMLGRAVAGGVTATGTAIGTAGVANVLGGFQLVEVDVELEKLPAAFDGFRIAQMSDIHVGPTIGEDFIRGLVDATNELKPDLIAITGDLVDGQVKFLSRHTAPLGDLSAKHGVYFVTGNHEYYSGADEWIDELARIGVPTLRNRSVRIEKDEVSFLLAGVTDHRAADFGDAPDLELALRGRRDEEEVVLLAHQPREVTEAVKHDVGLQLSGHTHGGQFWPWNWVVYLVQPVVKGLARFGRTQIYVNTGTGYWGPPMRVGTQSELTLIRLRSV